MVSSFEFVCKRRIQFGIRLLLSLPDGEPLSNPLYQPDDGEYDSDRDSQ